MVAEIMLDCARSPLQRGITLVEASAGTGKTYAIGMLVLRAVAEQAIPIDEILVVTFTRAATEELRSRIRRRLVEARDILSGVPSADVTITDWAATITEPQPVLERLRLALGNIDRAPIFTIHSFCMQMLTEQALESGQLFDVELKGDVNQVRNQVVEDFWRRRLYTMSPAVCGVIIRAYATPELLAESIALPGLPLARIVPASMDAEELITRFGRIAERFITWRTAHGEEVYQRFLDIRSEGKLKKDPGEKLEGWWRTVTAWCGGEGPFPEDLALLTRSGVKEALNGHKVKKKDQDEFLLSWPLPEAEVEALQEAARDLLVGLRCELAREMRHELMRRLERVGHMSFDDLIVRLDNALAGGNGGLVRSLGERFSMALIDEFQDTDAAQWRIFHALFGRSSHFLYLIGDPKQAIYRFRGADIFSYFQAKNSATHQLTLASNYRSHPLLVEEVNRIFGGRSRPFALDEEMIGFSPVMAARSPEDGELRRGGRPLPVMTYCQVAEDEQGKTQWSSGKADERIRSFLVREICRLLDPADPVTLCKGKAEKSTARPLAASDIAILVRSHAQAEQYLQALTQAGVPVVVASTKSVFATEEARELHILLAALAVPGDIHGVRRAMTISWFGLTGNELFTLWQDDALFDGWLDRFLLYHQLWQDKGFLTMMNRLLAEEEVYLHLAENERGERRIANIHHLLELVQGAEQEEKLGPERTLSWLGAMVGGMTDGGPDDQELRLESDEEAVRIVTMHGSKGLQYPVVFCPLLWYRSDRDARAELVSCHEDGELVVDFGSMEQEERRRRMIAESLAEELRLAYVALTRAEYCCYTAWADVKGIRGRIAPSFASALGYLLFPEGPCDFAHQQKQLKERSAAPGVVCTLLQPGEAEKVLLSRSKPAARHLTARTVSTRSLATDYQMSSYSAMASLTEQEDHGSDPPLDEQEARTPILHVDLPAGASFGNLIHDALERFPFADLASGAAHAEGIGQICRRYGMTGVREKVQALLATVVTSPLAAAGDGFSLAQLQPDCLIREMAFYYHMGQVDTRRINTILAPDPAVRPLGAKAMEGYLTGFVDLVCAHQGRYYILDYKTNYLGPHLEDYGVDRLTAAMASHNYGLQYWIYTLVLHRYLANVLPGYSYDDHFGGVYYLFVRGMTPGLPGNGVFATRPGLARLDELDLAIGGGR